jgi:hypothetical protein
MQKKVTIVAVFGFRCAVVVAWNIVLDNKGKQKSRVLYKGRGKE